ncbi:hypothetical protein M011DRAFT_474698 [Sporormia fimetaria CBS 119925]|uniref:Uncharacterized protein n=1 Tax=Sporormia fimetaria CBS 119925 TaxID=1340428 RepID=A0A6A6VJD0_9PLEO|nr:hypothetical protein M011DRAFT_474698 [Sporormia fimetaria CBS 119925]
MAPVTNATWRIGPWKTIDYRQILRFFELFPGAAAMDLQDDVADWKGMTLEIAVFKALLKKVLECDELQNRVPKNGMPMEEKKAALAEATMVRENLKEMLEAVSAARDRLQTDIEHKIMTEESPLREKLLYNRHLISEFVLTPQWECYDVHFVAFCGTNA